jgi:hypothetical protein
MIGVFFHTKIIEVCKKEKDATWKLDIFNSCLILLTFGLLVLMNGINYLIDDLHSYTGKWLCYTYKANIIYGNFSIAGHSFILSEMKYTIIVHHLKVREFGQERVKTIFFWINVIYSVCINAVFSIVRPEYFMIYDGVSVANSCLGLSDIVSSQDPNRSSTRLHNICEITEPTYKNSVEYVVYVFRTSLCWINVIFFYLNAWNVIECFVYFQTFRFMNR